MKDILEAPEGSAYNPSRKSKQVAYDTENVVHKPSKKKVVHQIKVQK